MNEIKYPITETFVSINGEGRLAGELAFFIRFRKCNLSCSYCDTRWSNQENAPAQLFTLHQLTDLAKQSGVKNITLTGGEPLLQENIDLLITECMKQGHHVEIETNGSILIQKLAMQTFRPAFTLDYKLPSSGMESHMLIENYQYLDPQQDVIKFVAGSHQDLNKTLEIIQNYHLSEKCQIYISPVFGQISPAEIVDFLKAHQLNQVRLQLQLHKYIWNPEQKGV